jgi:hypothetical protein
MSRTCLFSMTSPYSSKVSGSNGTCLGTGKYTANPAAPPTRSGRMHGARIAAEHLTNEFG